MTRTSRRLAVLAGAALLLLTGCGEGQIRPGAAAVVGDDRITTSELQDLVERGLADPQAEQQLGADLAAYQRLALSRLINALVLEQAAEQRGVSVTQGDVDAQIDQFAEQAGGRETLEQQAAQSGIAPEDLAPFVRSIVVDQRLGDELTADLDVPRADLQALYDEGIAQYDRVRSRHILVPDEATARRVLAEVTADRTRFAALAAELSTDTSNKDTGGDLGLAGRGQFVPEFENAIFGAKVGDVVLVQTQFGWHVVELLDRQTTTLAEATPELRRTALQAERQARVQELVQEVSDDLGISVNPRFGRWNPGTGQVEPEEGANGVLVPDEGAPSGEEELGGVPPGGEAPQQAPQDAPQEAPAEQPEPSPAG